LARELPFLGPGAGREAEDSDLVRDCIELCPTVIPRGGGTAYTGGAVPLTLWSDRLNTEKLETLGPLISYWPAARAAEAARHRHIWPPQGCHPAFTDAAERAGFVFAVVPRPADASA